MRLDFAGFPYRHLTDNEQRLLILLFELKSNKGLNSITRSVLFEGAALSSSFDRLTRAQIENTISNAIHSIQRISRSHFESQYNGLSERYVVSIPNVDGRKTGYLLSDRWLITTQSMARYGMAISRVCSNDRLSFQSALQIGANQFGLTDEESRFRLDWLTRAEYVQKEAAQLRITERFSLFERKYLRKVSGE